MKDPGPLMWVLRGLPALQGMEYWSDRPLWLGANMGVLLLFLDSLY